MKVQTPFLLGQLETLSILPCAGSDAFGHQPGRVALSLQLFVHTRHHKPLYVLQQRAPAAKGCQQQYAQELAEWVSQNGFDEVNGHEYLSDACPVHTYLQCMPAFIQQAHGLVMLNCLQVILLTSLDATLRQDRQMAGSSINFISSNANMANKCHDLGIEQLEVMVHQLDKHLLMHSYQYADANYFALPV